MNISVTGFASRDFRPSEETGLRSVDHGDDVTTIAGNGPVGPLQTEAGTFMRREQECAGAEPGFPVAGFATPAVRAATELARVRVGVTICTPGERFHVNFPDRCRILLLWHVAESTGDGGVPSDERKPRGAVIEPGEDSRLPALFVVTAAAFLTALARCELVPVRIRVTVHASREPGDRKARAGPRHRAGRRMALGARHESMLSPQGKTCARMIETLAARFPPRGGVAPLTRLLEFPTVRVPVTIDACTESEAGVPYGDSPHARPAVAEFAPDRLMLPRERESGAIMGKTRCGFPGVVPVALQTLSTQCPPVRVVVARGAIPGQSEIRPGRGNCHTPDNIDILDPFRAVTFPALKPPVFAQKLEAGRAMVERPYVPANECKFPSVMFLVTLNAGLSPQVRMITPPGADSAIQLNVALEASTVVNCLPESMARGAFPQPLQSRVGGGEFAGGDLRPEVLRGQEHDCCGEDSRPYGGSPRHLQDPQIPECHRNPHVDQENDQHDDAEGEMDHMPEREERPQPFQERYPTGQHEALGSDREEGLECGMGKSGGTEHPGYRAKFSSPLKIGEDDELKRLECRHLRGRTAGPGDGIDLRNQFAGDPVLLHQPIPQKGVTRIQIGDGKLVSLDSFRNLHIEIAAHNPAEEHCDHAPETDRDEAADFKRGMENNQRGTGGAEKDVKFQKVFELSD